MGKKKIIIIVVVILVILLALFSCGGESDDTSTGEETNNNAVAEETTTEEEQEEQEVEVKEDTTTEEEQTVEENTTTDSIDKTALAKELESKYGLKGGTSVRNDVTNSWTIEAIASAEAIDPSTWAYDYVQAYWKEGIKLMWIVNFSNRTTTSISTSDGSMLIVSQRDYVEDEEHDAKELGTGTVLREWIIYHDDEGNLVIDEA